MTLGITQKIRGRLKLPKQRRNRIKCKKCEDVIESMHVHDFKFGSRGSVAVDGGNEYVRRIGLPENYEELP